MTTLWSPWSGIAPTRASSGGCSPRRESLIRRHTQQQPPAGRLFRPSSCSDAAPPAGLPRADRRGSRGGSDARDDAPCLLPRPGTARQGPELCPDLARDEARGQKIAPCLLVRTTEVDGERRGRDQRTGRALVRKPRRTAPTPSGPARPPPRARPN
eukprot:31178-Pelagococcus_subviridis.AAC.2